MHARLALPIAALFFVACASPSSENAPQEGDPGAPGADSPIGQKTDATVSSDVAPSTTSGAAIAVRADAVPAITDAGAPKAVTARGDAGAVAPDAWGAPPKAKGDRSDGSPCTTGGECLSGMCEGEGCGVDEGRCMPAARACTKDLKVYCGCDDKTFRGSGTCPKATFKHKGACMKPTP